MAENAARVDWAGVGVRLAPRFCTPWGVRLAVRRALSRPALRARAASLAAWAFAQPGPRVRRGPAGALGRDAGRGYGAGGVGVGVGPALGTIRTWSLPVRPGVSPSPGSV